MANEKNLIPLNQRTKEEQRKIQRNAGIKSGKARRAKKTFQELAKTLLEMKPNEEMISLIQKTMPDLPAKKITAKVAMLVRLYDKAAKKGDIAAFSVLRDTIGEKPVDVVANVNTNPVALDKKEVREFADKLREDLL